MSISADCYVCFEYDEEGKKKIETALEVLKDVLDGISIVSVNDPPYGIEETIDVLNGILNNTFKW